MHKSSAPVIKRFPGAPLFDTASRLDDRADEDGHKAVQSFLVALPFERDRLERDLLVSLEYLQDYTSIASTFNRFRREVQRFLNYLMWRKHRLYLPGHPPLSGAQKFNRTPK